MSSGGAKIPSITGAPPKTASGGSAGNRSGSRFVTNYGRRQVNAYPVSDGDLKGLFAIGLASAVLFSVASGMLGFAVDIYKDLSLGGVVNVAPEKIAFWNALKCFFFIGAALISAAGVGLLVLGHHKISEIKRETTF